MRTKSLLVLLFAVLWTAKAAASGSALILDYHSFLGSGTSSLDFSPAELATQMDHFLALGYRFIAIEDALDGNLEGDNNLVLTIDDGHRTDLRAYMEVLKPRNIPVTLFIPGFSVGHDKHMLTVAQLQQLFLEGCTIGAHGFYHNYMTSNAYKKNPASVIAEAARSRAAIANMVGEMPDYFAYPFGGAGPEGKAAVQKAGYSWAFTASSKIVPVRPDDPALDHFYVPRTIVYRWSIEGLFKYLEAKLAHGASALRIQRIAHAE